MCSATQYASFVRRVIVLGVLAMLCVLLSGTNLLASGYDPLHPSGRAVSTLSTNGSSNAETDEGGWAGGAQRAVPQQSIRFRTSGFSMIDWISLVLDRYSFEIIYKPPTHIITSTPHDVASPNQNSKPAGE